MGDNLVFCWSGELRAYTVEQRLHHCFLHHGAQEHRRELQGDGRTPDRLSRLCIGLERVIQEQLSDFLADLRELLDQFCALLGG